LPDAITNSNSVFGLIQHTFYNKLKVQTGLRYDQKNISTQSVGFAETPEFRQAIDRSYGSFSGSLGATYNVSEELLFRTNFAAAYRTPNLAELTSNGQHELRFEVGDSRLVPENAYESDLSLHYHRESFTFDVAVFYNLINDYIFIAPTGSFTESGIGIYQYCQANSGLLGGEAGLHIHPKQIEWLHLEATFASVTGKQKGGDYLPFVPANKLRFDLQAEKEQVLFFHQANVSLLTSTTFAQNHVAPDESVTRGYALVDIGFGGNIKAGSQFLFLRLSVNNLFDKKYIDHLSTLKEVNLYNPGRNIALSLKIPFGSAAKNNL
jgi:iron complex outermembrane receptor protein